MDLNRRNLFRFAGGASAASLLGGGGANAVEAAAAPGPVTLPDRASFVFDGIHMNAAYTHPISLQADRASRVYADSRMREVGRNWPVANARDEAVALYAKLINASPTEIAVVPSTLEGENLISDALGLGPGAGVVTDAFHYDASLVRYGELARRGMPLTVVAPRDHRIDYPAMEAAITPRTRLVAVSLVSSATGYRHDLERLCAIAHARGALVYADIIQAVGGVPFDVRASGIDFCCAGAYKWLMGEFGAAFLYVRGDRLKQLRRVQLGWRAVRRYSSHVMPDDPPGPVGGEWTLGDDTASMFEVSTANWGGLATTVGALRYIQALGVERIEAHRRPMLDRLRTELPRAGFRSLTPIDAAGPSLVFEYQGARERLGPALKQARIYVTLYKNAVRISPSVHNDMGQVEALLSILARSG